MKKLQLICLSLFTALSLFSQPYGKEWISYSQKYFKFRVYKEGVYRIPYSTLSNYFDLSTVNPKSFQLFFKGREQFIFIRNEANNVMGPGDYIDFYANPNHREIDSLIYTNIQYVPNPFLPLFNDTVSAFITVSNSLNNKRYVLETDTNSAPHTAIDHVYTERVHAIRELYNYVPEEDEYLSSPYYTQAEGRGAYFHPLGNSPQSITSAFGNLNPYTSASLPSYLSIVFWGGSKNTGYQYDHSVRTSFTDQNLNQVVLKDTLFSRFGHVRQTFTLSSQNLNNASAVTVSATPHPSIGDSYNVNILSHIYFRYPQTLNLDAKSAYRIFVSNSNTSKGFYNFSNFNFDNGDSALCYDFTNGRRIRTVKSGVNNLRVLIPNGISPMACYITAETQTISVPSLTPVGQNGYFTDYRDPSATNPYLTIYHAATKSGALEYQDYRQTMSGGSYNVISADIKDLYDQFAYGVNAHPLSIRNYIRFMHDSMQSKPKFIFIIGHGVNPLELRNPLDHRYNLVPTIGVPGNDNVFTALLTPANTNSFYPEIPIGRIAAHTSSEVSTYLEKVQVHESSGPAEWKKKVLHFIGGNDQGLTQSLSLYMAVDSAIISDTLFGANVLTFKKNTSAPIQINISDSIKNTISNGASLITFFGHGSEQGFDQAIDDPELYNNKDKYPFVVANSCYSGNIHVAGRKSVSERFVFAKQKGSIGFLSSTSSGFVFALKNYNDQLYIALSRTRYFKPIGEVIQEAAMKNAVDQNRIIRLTSLDMTLHGDPAVKIGNGLIPDYRLENKDVSFDLKKYTDSVGVKIKLLNLGAAVHDTFYVKVKRYFPNGDSVTVFKKRRATMYRDTVKFYLPIDFTRGIGLNRFTVKVDDLNDVGESNETNNATFGTVDLFIPGGDILPVYPYKYAIVPKTNTIVLKASTTDPFAPLNAYRFQLDTSDRFTSPIQTALISSKGGVLEWTVNLPYADSTVYFWRVSRDSTGPSTPFIWKESSFQTIGNKRGWAQAHFHQFKNDAYQFVSYKKPLRKFTFENTKYSVSCRNGIHPAVEGVHISYYFNNIVMSNWGCAPNGWNIAVFDGISGQPERTKSLIVGPELGPYNNCVCSDEPLNYVSFGQNPSGCSTPNWKQDLENFLDQIPENKYVLAYSIGWKGSSYTEVSSYSNSLYSAFERIGAASIRQLTDTVAYIVFGKKVGKTQPLSAGNEKIGLNRNSVLLLYDSIETNWNNGHIASEMIGPSFKWKSLHWKVGTLDIAPGDTTVLKVVGYKSNGQADTLATFPVDSSDVLNLGNYADASQYPYLKLVALMKDNIFRTSPQLKKWQVIYDEAPECALNPLKGFASINDSLQEGDVVTFRFPIENVSTSTFNDSLVVTYWVEDNSRNKVLLPHKMKVNGFAPGQVLIDTVKVNSYQLAGSNGLWIFVNPITHAKYQHEQYQFNNIGRYSFKVSRDVTNPLLDVTFDGVRILNGDIVSAKPNILITLKDENKFLELNDTSAFTVSLMSPGSGSPQKLYFAKDLQFTPASLPRNSCAINYNPNLTVDGKYTLIAQAKDRSANRSGIQNYEVSFEVHNKPTVTNMLNYPNPFSTSTRFVFTLTGSEVPEVMTIQIMTISGKVVREITRDELGALHIGRNITDYAWDGRDEYGDKLGNGVYLYRVITKLNGEHVEKSATNADKFFVRDFGKMVLMR